MRKNTILTAAAAALLSVSLPTLCPSGPCVGPAVAYGQDDDPEVTRMAKEHYKLGLDAYKGGKYDVAIKELKKAYLLKRLPAILINIALTYRKTKDYDMAIYFYKKFLGEVPADDKQRPSAESGLAETEAEKTASLAPAKPEPVKPAVEIAQPKPAAPAGGAGSSSGPAVPAVPAVGAVPAVPAAASGTDKAGTETAAAPEWSHTAIDAVPPNQPVDVQVQMPVMKGVKVKVYFRKEGQASFDSLELKRRGNEKIARLPAAVTSGRTFQYYLEARDGAGTLIKSSGSEASPNIVLIDASARQQVAGAEAGAGEDENAGKGAAAGYSRDIENESASFDMTKEQRSAMDKLHEQLGKEKEGPGKKYPFGTLGWIGIGAASLGALSLAGGITSFALASGRATAVAADSTCAAGHQVNISGMLECPHFGPNPVTTMSYSLPSPTSSDFESQGLAMNLAGKILVPVGGVLLAGGAGLLTYDILSRRAKERAALEPPKKAKKKKVRKVIEVEEETLLFAPVLGPKAVGLSGGFRF